MKSLLAVVVCFVLMVSLPGLSAQAAPPTIKTITIWHVQVGEQLPAIQQLLSKYENDHRNVKINLEFSPTGDIATDLYNASGTGTEPDIVWWANDIIGSMALFNLIIDLDQLGIHDNWLNSTYAPAAAQGVQYNGKIWALPEAQEGIALVYNKALVPPEYLPADPFDFAALYAKASAYLADTGRPLICNQGFPGWDAYHIAPVFFGFGVPTYIDEAGNAYLNTPEAISAGTWLSQMPPLSPAEQSHMGCHYALINGQVGMWWTGPWALAALNNAGLDYGILPMGRPFVGIKAFMITAAAKERGNAQVALDIAKFMTNTANAISLTWANGTIPANRAALKNPLVQRIPSVAGFGASINLGVPMSPSPYSVCQWEPVGIAEALIWMGWDVQEVLDWAQGEIENCVSSMMTP